MGTVSLLTAEPNVDTPLHIWEAMLILGHTIVPYKSDASLLVLLSSQLSEPTHSTDPSGSGKCLTESQVTIAGLRLYLTRSVQMNLYTFGIIHNTTYLLYSTPRAYRSPTYSSHGGISTPVGKWKKIGYNFWNDGFMGSSVTREFPLSRCPRRRNCTKSWRSYR